MAICICTEGEDVVLIEWQRGRWYTDLGRLYWYVGLWRQISDVWL
jgi:hypothetical protein